MDASQTSTATLTAYNHIGSVRQYSPIPIAITGG